MSMLMNRFDVGLCCHVDRSGHFRREALPSSTGLIIAQLPACFTIDSSLADSTRIKTSPSKYAHVLVLLAVESESELRSVVLASVCTPPCVLKLCRFTCGRTYLLERRSAR